uniref:Reverse transcriptase domain-containing protein n=1 Tax=Fagus sylvatica TaxID=28930 RepID=A0A2N9I1Y1_FAGSY
MPPKTRQRRNQREVSVHTEHSRAESAVNIQGEDQQRPPPSGQNQEVPPTNLLLELIQNLQQNQSELAEAIKQLKEKDAGTKTPPQNGEENQEKPHQDSGSHEKEATFVTMSDIADLLKQEREKNPKEPRLFGSALVHISKFVDSMGAYAGNGDLCLREFSKSLDDRAYTWYTTLPPGSVKAAPKGSKRRHYQSSLILRSLKKRRVNHKFLTVSTVNNKRKKSNERSFDEAPPPVPCTLEEMKAILDKWVADGIIKLPEAQKKDCWTLRRKFHEKIPRWNPWNYLKYNKRYILTLSSSIKDRGVVSVVIHGSTSDAGMDESATASTAMTPTAIKALQRNPRFRSLFNQLGLNPEARTAATEAIVAIAADFGAHCFTAETHASRAFLETTNAITFTDEDMEVQYPDHRRPLYLSATINEVQVRRALVDNGSCINLIPLSTIQAAEIPQKKIQGAPMEIKGFGGVGEYTKGHIQLVLKPCMMKSLQQEKHHLPKPIGIPLPKWEEIRDAPGADLRDLLEQKKKRKAEASTSKSQPQLNEASMPESADAAEPVAADPKVSAEEELENIKMLFAWQYDEMPGIDPKLVAHSLNVEPGTRPVVQPMRTFHPEVEAQITQEVKKLLSAGFIKPIQHPRWLSNIVPVKKKNAAGHAMFSFMDGFSGYNQIFMTPRDAEKTAFRTPIGNFYYTVMPFGLKNAGATYQRTMTAMFHDMMHREIEDYVDDIVVKSKTRGDHFGVLKKVFERCRLYKLKMNPLKCAFGVSAGKFLGFLVHQRGIDVDPARASAIATMKPPTYT